MLKNLKNILFFLFFLIFCLNQTQAQNREDEKNQIIETRVEYLSETDENPEYRLWNKNQR